MWPLQAMDPCKAGGGDSPFRAERRVCLPTPIREVLMVIGDRFSYQAIRDVLGGLPEQDLHAKRVNSLCDATLGVLYDGCLAICAIGQCLAAGMASLTIGTKLGVAGGVGSLGTLGKSRRIARRQ
ncbi:MAG TPA: hypothetical protein VKI44_02460, partial [Acetobacteraceae bacterium]|nr:hypothetical protein [Acetobacteraceae bacterium]